jgi:phosphatidylserine/phosphatidylglycerophosphate/cardiolipin synthase-like enzyme
MKTRSVAQVIACILTLTILAEAQTLVRPPLIFPQFAVGNGYQTTFTLTNPTSTPTVATISLSNSSMSTNRTVTVPANGSARLSLSDGSLGVGFASISALPPVELDALETIQLWNGAVVRAEVSSSPATPDIRQRLPVLERDGMATGVAVVNSGDSAAAVTAILRRPDGAMAGLLKFALNPGEQAARFIAEAFNGVSDFEGSLEISSDSPVAAFAVRQHASGTFSSVPVSTASSGAIDALFSPKGGIAATIVQEMRKTQTSMDIAIYSFTRDEIGDAVIAAKNRGVAIRIIVDSGQAPGPGSEIAKIEAAGIPVKRITGIGTNGIMHNKYAILDGSVLLTGSYNWSTNAEENSFENAIFLRNSATISAYQANFNSIWNTH